MGWSGIKRKHGIPATYPLGCCVKEAYDSFLETYMVGTGLPRRLREKRSRESYLKAVQTTYAGLQDLSDSDSFLRSGELYRVHPQLLQTLPVLERSIATYLRVAKTEYDHLHVSKVKKEKYRKIPELGDEDIASRNTFYQALFMIYVECTGDLRVVGANPDYNIHAPGLEFINEVLEQVRYPNDGLLTHKIFAPEPITPAIFRYVVEGYRLSR